MVDDLYLRQVYAEVDAVARECDASFAQLKQRSSNMNLVNKVYDDAKVPTEAPSEAEPEILTEAQIDAIGQALALERERRREEMQPIIDGLQRQIDELRGELKITRDPARGSLALVRKSDADAA